MCFRVVMAPIPQLVCAPPPIKLVSHGYSYGAELLSPYSPLRPCIWSLALGILADHFVLQLKLHSACSTVSAHRYPFHSHIVKQFSKLNVFERALQRFRGKAMEKKRRESLTHKYINNWKQTAFPQLCHGKVHSWRCYHQGAAVEWERCMMPRALGASSLSSPFIILVFMHFFFNLTLSITFFREISLLASRPRSTLFTHTLISRCSCWPRHSLTYADPHAYSANVSGSVSLWLITVCSPPQMPAQDQETTVRLFTSFLSNSACAAF